ncbi:MAG: citrate/2-methylcitrate synthase [Chloroflexi bacterium]|nr:citrate/2-methylcitrate synthase [Chloroflexota bacterium]MCY4247785.1 citrate/2-methylcitrate synthase [Chloroflexota bacterium]
MANQSGLEGIAVADIATSFVDGSAGELIYSGYAIEDLAENATFEEVLFLLFHSRLPNRQEYDELRATIAANSAVDATVMQMLRSLPKDTSGMSALRTAVSMLAAFDPDAENLLDKDVAARKALRLTGQIMTICAAWIRIVSGKNPVQPRGDLGVAQNFVYMMSGEEPDKTACAALDVYLVLLAEHGMNASTFAARVVTATGSDLHSAIVAGIGALKGPAHGGANSAAMSMFLEIGEVDHVAPWFEANIKSGKRRIMGIGHRVYKAPDPRAAILKRHAKALAASSGKRKWFDIADKLDQTARADAYFIQRKLYPNVDYYSAIVLYTLDLDVDMFTPLFAMARIAGWSAHVIAQMGGRLIRPKANYVGPRNQTWLPLDER